MRITNDMIDPELRTAALLAKLMRPNRFMFRFMADGSNSMAGRNVEGLDCAQIQIPRSDGGEIRTRIYKPLNAPPNLPVLLYIHGGGYVMGAPETFHTTIQQFIVARPCVVVCPAYRRAFDAPYPAALDDCYDVLLWIKNNAASIGGRNDQIFVGGHSAGGGLTAALSLRARDRGEVRIAFQMPIYPMIDDRAVTESARDNNAPMWSSKHNALGWKLYLASLNARGAPIPAEAAPARATDYSNLPPTLTLVGDLEPFRDETIAYVENLKRAGVPVDFRLYKGAFHGFDVIAPKSQLSKDALAFTYAGFAHAVDNYFAAQPA